MARPLCTLERALAVARSGSRIVVRKGSYPALAVGSTNGRNAYVTISPQAQEQVTIERLVVSGGASFLRLEGVAVSNGVAVLGQSRAGTGSRRIAIVRCRIDTVGNDAILLEWGTHDVLIEGNSIHSTNGGNGITLNSQSNRPGVPEPGATPLPPVSNVTIRNNRLIGIGTDAIRPANFEHLVIEGNEITGVVERGNHSDVLQVVWGGNDLVFRDNYVHDNRGQGFFIKDGLVTNVLIENNVFVRNRFGFQIAIYETQGLQLVNNTVWDNEHDASLGDNLRDVVIQNNALGGLIVDGEPAKLAPQVKQDYNVIGGGWNWGARGRHDRRGSVRFLDPGRDDYRLAPGSLGIDVGTGNWGPSRDKACRPRYDARSVANRGAGMPRYVDAGALEYTPKSQPGDTTASSGCLRLSLRNAQLVGGRLFVDVRASAAARVAVAGTASWGRAKASIAAVRRSLPAEASVRMRLSLPSAARTALASGRALFLTLELKARSANGAAAVLVRRMPLTR